MHSTTQPAFPIDNYTPHGYLDIPEHSKRANPQGVMRSHDLGFRWHSPAFAGMYGGRRETYRAGLRVAIDGVAELVELPEVQCPYHSKNVVQFVIPHDDGSTSVEFHMVGGNALVGRLTTIPGHRISIAASYTRLIGADFSWGESGLVARHEGDVTILQAFEDGEAFALWVSTRATCALTSSESQAATWLREGVPADGEAPVTALGDRGDNITVNAVTDLPGETTAVEFILARGLTADQARQNLAQARSHGHVARERLLEQDENFWRSAPRLTGDWPEHWRRGLVYDLETVRMMVKPPAGIYKRPWDAMQIQAPRVVLGEAAIDALLLSYADPQAAQQLMLGTFDDAPLPQVPCSREDGSYNMVSAHGQVCGTGPQWGYPWVVLGRLWDLRPDTTWLAEIFPHLDAYLSWWLKERDTGDGWLGHACSWESGQDLSPRFGDQPLGGGHPTPHLRPVDLHASFAHAAETTAKFARELGDHDAAHRWDAVGADYRARTAQLWNGTTYRDYDTTTDSFTDVDDIMLMAPVALGMAQPDQQQSLATSITHLDEVDYVWPMFAWTAVDTARTAGHLDIANRVATKIIDRAYGFWDRRTASSEHSLPGIACEYWPLSGRCGGEGYGWGAFTTYLLLDSLLGVRISDGHLHLRPNLPDELRVDGAEYGLTISLGGGPKQILVRPRGGEVEVVVSGETVRLPWGQEHSWPIG